jgi:predicted nucleic acid-binding protein
LTHFRLEFASPGWTAINGSTIYAKIPFTKLKKISSYLSHPLPDSGDQPFLEVAVAGQAVSLVTGNHAHYPPNLRQGVKVLSPSEFLNFYRRQQKGKNT